MSARWIPVVMLKSPGLVINFFEKTLRRLYLLQWTARRIVQRIAPRGVEDEDVLNTSRACATGPLHLHLTPHQLRLRPHFYPPHPSPSLPNGSSHPPFLHMDSPQTQAPSSSSSRTNRPSRAPATDSTTAPVDPRRSAQMCVGAGRRSSDAAESEGAGEGARERGTGRMPRTLAPRPSCHDEETHAAPREGEPTDGRGAARPASKVLFFLSFPPAEFRSGPRSTTLTHALTASAPAPAIEASDTGNGGLPAPENTLAAGALATGAQREKKRPSVCPQLTSGAPVPERTGEAVGDDARKARSRPCSAEMGVVLAVEMGEVGERVEEAVVLGGGAAEGYRCPAPDAGDEGGCGTASMAAGKTCRMRKEGRARTARTVSSGSERTIVYSARKSAWWERDWKAAIERPRTEEALFGNPHNPRIPKRNTHHNNNPLRRLGPNRRFSSSCACAVPTPARRSHHRRNLRWVSPTSNTQFLSENALLLIIVRTGKLNQGQDARNISTVEEGVYVTCRRKTEGNTRKTCERRDLNLTTKVA
ncbi:hypothetical protein B0H14DRAFT_3125675 [Mycena olivaceomarginata]|nr:hypothetical protein B0H14DRAFT_3125675 [Mycena olivaceomarginata]